jgi:hypothetical protein
MAIHSRVAAKLQDYMVNRNLEALKDLVSIVQAEIQDPSMQEAILTIRMTRSDVEQAVMEDDFLKLPILSVDSDVPVHEDKMVRVICQDQPDESCLIFRVGSLDDNFIKLFPIGGFDE